MNSVLAYTGIRMFGNGNTATLLPGLISPVGRKAVNNLNDVKIVNNLLWIANEGNKFTAFNQLPPPGTGTIIKLPESIEAFQKWFNKNMQFFRLPYRVSVDGRVSPARKEQTNWKTNYYYTLVPLTLYARAAYLSGLHKSVDDVILATTPGLSDILQAKVETA